MPSFTPESPDPSNAELLSAAAGGDQDAWNTLVARYGRLVWSVARSFRLSPADTADLSQTAWLRLVENLGSITESERLGAWLATTTRREAIRLLRRRNREIPADEQEEQSDEGADGPEERILVDDEYRQLRAAMAQLPERCRTLLRVLAADSGASYAQLSAAMGLPIGSIGPTRARCLEKLRAHMS
ncbi:RNA polymerase sigma factor [Actinospica robiniae]|uniref:RNA polymerase sigma factor n=1 Tax=Actinospica robiniae TaxID=304901 RepID=UPI00041763C0|nr:sigma-70 family RNA polymerase sigma factor [Actinospica robiniae]